MTKWLMVFFFAFMSFCLNAEEIQNTEYQEQIWKAENYLIEGEYKEGMEEYRKAIKNTRIAFLYDFLLPLQLAIELNDTSSFRMYLQNLELTHSIKEDLASKFEKNLKSWDENWKKILMSGVDCTEGTVYNVLIDSLFKCDQKERANVYNTFFLKRKKVEKKWDQNSAERIKVFIKTAEESGFPTEHQMGIDGDFFYHRNLMVICYHYPKTYSRFKSFFDRWLQSGKLHPRHYAWIVDFEERHQSRKQQKKAYFTYGVFAEVDPKFELKKIKREELVFLNKSRLEIGLPRLGHYQRLTGFIKEKGFFKPTFL